MRLLIISLSVIVVVIFAQRTNADSIELTQNCKCGGIWAANGKPPYVGPDFAPSEIPAPNGRVSLKAYSGSLSLVGRKHSINLRKILVNPPLMEVLWSPDSRNFVVNVSDGGLVGSWDTYFYSVDQDEYPAFRDIESLIRPIANKLPQCDMAEQANIGTVAWLNEGKELLLVAEVPPHSSCRNMGDLLGFRISVESWRITERISEDRLRKKWGKVLGCRFAHNCGNEPDHKLKRSKQWGR